MVTLKDVARKAGVSEATVSLVLNNRPGVNSETRDKVSEIAKELGYTPNTVARSLALKKTHTIGLVVTDIENPFFGSITRYISENAHKNAYTLIIAASNDDLKLEEEIINIFIGRQVDGIIVVPTQEMRNNYEIFDALKNRNIPFVFATSFYPEHNKNYVITDYTVGSYKLTKYLLELGHRKILHFIIADENAPISKFRIDGYKKAYTEMGLHQKDEWIIKCPKPDFQSGYMMASRILNQTKTDAIIAINDVLALGAKRAAKEKGFIIPKDISIAGYDDVIFSSISEIPLTTVRQNIPEIARLSVELLLSKIEKKQYHQDTILIEPELIVRQSTGIAPKRDTP